MSVNIKYLFIFCALFVPIVKPYTLCAKLDYYNKEKCKLLKRDRCIFIQDSVNCMLKLQDNIANFGSFNSEQLYMISHLLNETFVIIEEIRHLQKLNDESEFETAVIVRKNVPHDLKGTKYCHPGYYDSLGLSNRVLSEFERFIISEYIPHKDYNKDLTIFENDVQHLASFFGESCRPGTWVEDEELNNNLQYKYPSLIELCKRSSKNYLLEAVNCLVKQKGDIVYTDYSQAKRYFELNPHVDRNQFMYLCRNGSRFPLDINTNPCPWVRQMLPVVVASNYRKYAGVLKNYLRSKDEAETKANNIIWQILGVTDNEQQYPVEDTLKPIAQYVREFRGLVDLDPFDKSLFIVRWCVTTPQELDKCNLLRTAAITLGILPEIECIYTIKPSILKCYAKIRDNLADIVVSDANYGYIARHGFNLRPIAYEKSKDKSMIVAVVKEESIEDIKSLSDLKEKNACFPLYQGIAWRAVRTIVKKNENLVNDSLATYFSNVCAPGWDEVSNFINNGSNLSDNIICAEAEPCVDSNCSELLTTLNRNNDNALDCLDTMGDVAFISLKENEDLKSPYRVLCRNNTIANKNVRIDEECALFTMINSEVLTRENESNNLNIRILLKQIEKHFNSHSQFRTMNAFTTFRAQPNILFTDTAQGFIMADNEDYHFTSYDNLANDYHHLEKASGLSIGYYFLIFISIILIVLLVSFLIYNIVMRSEYHRANRLDF